MNAYENIPRPALYVIERTFSQEIATWERMAGVYRDELSEEDKAKTSEENANFFQEQLGLVERILNGN